MTADVVVGVVSPLRDDASFVIQSVPAKMIAGQSYDVAIRMRNSGASTWTAAGGYKLLAQRPQGGTQWGVGALDLSASLTSVLPNGEAIFTFRVTGALRSRRVHVRMANAS